MNTAIIRRACVFLVAGWIAAGCSSRSVPRHPEQGKGGAAAQEVPLSDREAAERAEAFARFATGVTHELNDHNAEALEQFSKAVEADPSNELLAVELTKRLLQKGQGEKALKLLSKVEARPGSSGTVSAWMARACLQAGRTNQAIQAGRNAIRKSPEDIGGYQVLVVEIYLQNRQPREAAKVLTQAAGVTSTNIEFLLRVTELNAIFQRMQPREAEAMKPQALAVLKRVTALKPTNPAILQRLADNYNLFGDSKTAAEIYLGLIEEYSDESGMRDFLRERLTNIYLNGSEKEKAAGQLEAIIRDNPGRFPQAYYFLGMLAGDRKEFDKAIDYMNRGLALRPEHEQSYYDLASIQLNADRPDEALKTLDRAREKFPRSYVVEFLSGLTQSRKKNYAEAVKCFTTAEVIASATEPRRLTAGFYYYFGAAAERQKDFALAEKLFLKSIEIDSNFGESLNYVGYMWADRNEKLDRALEFIERAVKLEPKNAAFLDSLGWVHFRLNQPKKALEYILRSIEHTEEPDATLYDHLGDIHRALGQRKEAGEAWQKSLKIESNEEVKRKIEKLQP